MDTESWLATGVLIFSCAVLALATTAHSAFLALRRPRLALLIETGIRGADTIEHLIQRPGILRSTFVISDSIAIIGASAAATFLAMKHFAPDWRTVLVLAGLTFLVLLFCKMAPKTVAERYPERTALLMVNLVQILTWAFSPLAWAFAWLADGLLQLLGLKPLPPQDEPQSTAVLEILQDPAVIDATEKKMIRGVLQLEETAVREIMMPRVDIVAAEVNEPLSKVRELIGRHGRSRIPIYEGTIDRVIGIVNAKDLLNYPNHADDPGNLRELLRPAYFVPETKRLADLLKDMQMHKVHMAIVVDEYGGTAGLVTIEDLLEEIVGEIQDEYDTQEAQILRVSEEEAIVDGRVHIDELNELFGLHIQGDDFDTIGGFVYHHLGRVPAPGEEVQVDSLRISILSTLGRRIVKLRVRKVSPLSNIDNAIANHP